MPRDYDIGYAKPPKKNQFKKGQSGNSKGRPKGTKNLKSDLLEEFNEKISIREGPREIRVSKQRAIIKSLLARALKGSDSAAGKLIDLYLRITDLSDEAENAGIALSKDEAEVLEKLEARIRKEAFLDADLFENDPGDKS